MKQKNTCFLFCYELFKGNKTLKFVCSNIKRLIDFYSIIIKKIFFWKKIYILKKTNRNKWCVFLFSI